MSTYNLGMLLICILIVLYMIVLLLMHISGVQTINDWREANKRMNAETAKDLKMVWCFLKEHKTVFLPVLKFLKWLIRMAVKCICLLPNLIIRFVIWIRRINSGEDILEQLPDPSLGLSDDELKELTKRLNGNPYNSPTFCLCSSRMGVNYYEFSSISLKESYKELVGETLFKKVRHVLRNYLMETRSIPPDIYVTVATPTRLIFAIPISEFGKKSMLRAFSTTSTSIQTDSNLPVLTEEIIFPNSEEKTL